jgi:hypothetical protein
LLKICGASCFFSFARKIKKGSVQLYKLNKLPQCRSSFIDVSEKGFPD